MFIQNLFSKLATSLGFSKKTENAASPSSATPGVSRSPLNSRLVKEEKSVLTDQFIIKNMDCDDPDIYDQYDRAFALIKKLNDRVLRPTMLSYRSGDWYILHVDLLRPPSEEFTYDDDDPSTDTRAVYVVDMSREHVIQTGDLDALTPVFEKLKTRSPHQYVEDESTYLTHITTILAAVINPFAFLVEPNGGRRSPEKVSSPKYEIQGDSLIYTWFEYSRGMNYEIIKHTIVWDGKTVTHQETGVDMTSHKKA